MKGPMVSKSEIVAPLGSSARPVYSILEHEWHLRAMLLHVVTSTKDVESDNVSKNCAAVSSARTSMVYLNMNDTSAQVAGLLRILLCVSVYLDVEIQLRF